MWCSHSTDIPDPPRFLNVDTIYHDSVMLTWKPPLNDGGGFITQYIVEKLEQGMANWIRCCTTRYDLRYDTIQRLHSKTGRHLPV